MPISSRPAVSSADDALFCRSQAGGREKTNRCEVVFAVFFGTRPVFSGTVANVALHTDELQALNALEKKQFSVVLLNYAVCKEETVEYIRLILKANITLTIE